MTVRVGDSEFNIQNYDMDLYTLSPRFFWKYKIEHYSSFIWTERYSAAGDFEVVMPPTPLWMSILVPGCLVIMRGRRDVMMVENVSFESGLMTVTGSGLMKFFNQRISWFKNPDYDPPDNTDLFADYERDDLKPGEFIWDVINKLCVHLPAFNSPYDDIRLDQKRDKFANLLMGYRTNKGHKKSLSFPNGQPIYDALAQIAGDEHVGIQLYLERANMGTGEYVLRFRTHLGKDRTSSQHDRETIRFTPKLESLLDPKELRSNLEYKNVCYVNYKGKVTVHYAPHVRHPPVGFKRQVTYVDGSDKKVKASKVPAYRRRLANAEFRKHRHTHQVDGQVIANLSEFMYGFDYQLGDIVEVEGHSGMIVKARVSEYVRSQDQFGPKVYPTLEILAEDETNYHSDPTFEPDVEDPIYPESPSFASMINSESTPVLFSEDDEDPDFTDINPFDQPIFEGDEESIFDPQEQVGDLLDPEDPETPPVTSQGLSALTPWEVSDWDYEYTEQTKGFYVHQGNVYVLGTAFASGGGAPGSDVLLSGIPPQYAPDAPATGKVLIDHVNSTLEYAYDSGLKIGPWLDVTIDPNGTVTFDDGNPFQAPTNSYDWSGLAIHLSALTWPMSSQIYDAYDSDHSLEDWVQDPPWQNNDGYYSAHDERLHLNGTIVKVSDEDVIAPLIGIPFEFQPLASCIFPNDAGYLFAIAEASYGDTLGLYEVGAQDPQAAGNKGCGFWTPYFYERLSDSYLIRGSTPTLSFTPATADVGVEYTGASGSPIGDLPDSADWIGDSYQGTILFKLADLISMAAPVGTPSDYSGVQGINQFSFICGIAPGIESYYKVVFTYDSSRNRVSASLLLEHCGDARRSLLARKDFLPFVAPDGTVQLDFSLDVSADSVFDYGATPHPGYNYWLFQPGSSSLQTIGSDYDQTLLPGNSAKLSSGNPKGDMGFHIPPSTPKVLGAKINGLGSFPRFALDDVIDFTNCGWPLVENEGEEGLDL